MKTRLINLSLMMAIASLPSGVLAGEADQIVTAEQECAVQTSFEDRAQIEPWRVINDGVMGGLSKGRISYEDEALVFDGFVNTNGGGFTSIRRSVDPDSFRNVDAIRLRVRADVRDYRLTFRTRQSFRGRNISWQAPIRSAKSGDWEDVTVPFSELRPSVFGRTVPSEPFDRHDVREMGVIIADGVDGPFRLEVKQIDCMTDQ